MRATAIVLGVLLTACPGRVPAPTTSSRPAPTPDAGVASPTSPAGPAAPTLRLPRTFLPTRYTARLAIDPAKTGFTGAIAIVGTLDERSSTIWLNATRLTVTHASATRDEPTATAAAPTPLVATPHGDDWLELRAPAALAPGTWTIALDYAGELDTVNTTGAFKQVVGKAKDAYVFSQLEAVYARRVFPCFDEPDNKVPWQLTLDVPTPLVAVSNTPIVGEVTTGATRRVEFAPTRPLPSYLVAFAVGPFAIVDAGTTKGGTPIKIYALAGRQAEAAYAAQTAARILDLAEEWFAIPYPYPKLDLVTIPLTVGFSAMENAGMITFSERTLLLDAQASKARARRWVVVAAHEFSHQWFGDLVTMRWWDDIWLNEGFANWLAHKLSARFDPTWHEEQTDVDTRNGALEADSLASARQVRQPIARADDIFTAFDGITYNKGAAILNMFETYVGADVFQRGVRAYLTSKAYGSATSADLIAAIGAAAGKDLVAAFGSFLDAAGAPELAVGVTCAPGKPPSIALEQHRYLPPGGTPPAELSRLPVFTIPVCLAYDNAGARATTCTLLDRPTASLKLATACPRWVMPNVDARGYFRVAYTPAQLTALRDEAWPLLAQSERRSVVFDAATATSRGTLPIAAALSFVPKLLVDADRFTVGDALDLPGAFKDLVPDDLRPKFEQWLRATFGPGALAVGMLPRPNDTIDDESMRARLIAIVGWTGREPKLVDEAVRLAATWTTLPEAMRGLILRIAVDARPEIFERVRQDLYTEAGRGRRGEILAALGAVRDTRRQARALELMLDPSLDIRETSWLLWGVASEANRVVAQEFFKAHQAAILARIPPDGTASSAAGIAEVFTASCDPTRRDAIVAYVTATFVKLPGGERTVQQAIDAMDQCIASRALVLPELRGWLTGVKIPKPSAPVATPAKPAKPVKPARPRRK
ncbi:MAG: M1 family metallopeptidase [Proteobacteria bacterium]|nr:M1 family metallopeptidase [Pseudomonadota bacterium]